MFAWAWTLDVQVFLTIRFNQELSDAALHDRMKKFDALLNRLFLGRSWHKYPSAERVLWLAFFERDRNGTAAVHAHVPMRLPRKVGAMAAWKWPLLGRVLTQKVRAKHIAPCGDVVCSALDNEIEQSRAIAYAAKEFEMKTAWSRESSWMISEQFHAVSRTRQRDTRAATGSPLARNGPRVIIPGSYAKAKPPNVRPVATVS